MLIDCQIKPSRLRAGCFVVVNIMVLLLIITASGIPALYKMILAAIFSLINLGSALITYLGLFKTPLLHVWQVNRCEWYVLDVGHSQAVAVELLAIDFRGFAVYLCFRIHERRETVVLWKDQLNQSEWRKFKVLSRLHQASSHSVF